MTDEQNENEETREYVAPEIPAAPEVVRDGHAAGCCGHIGRHRPTRRWPRSPWLRIRAEIVEADLEYIEEDAEPRQKPAIPGAD